ncbi:nucleolar GTP-binding protein 2-like [Mizuhopecten yessoensis]|uniref:Nucleolar GTP-binding protein 2 n=1 Tax=Mizuhopecten yessoensis TaxID=6573 RepID=A0A210QJE9_MIZYE|nr:nucleolar GTP-binding protein 2-like [Mizuhopecten yessoensis]OWF48898.1 Nucleolar GTP-binding protein 2 [Mizuhopecten yessoensis]
MAKTSTKKPRIRDYVNKSNHSMNPDRKKGEGGSNMRDRATIKRLQMYKNFKPKRDSTGKITKAAPFQSRLPSGTVARVEPNRKWFGNTRVITQNALQTFQEEMTKVKNDPYKVVMRQTKLPITLLNETAKHARVHLLDTESFETTFGKRSQRKKPNLKFEDMQALMEQASSSAEKYDSEKDRDLVTEEPEFKLEAPEVIFKAGQSRRVWGELYKVIDSSDVVIQVLDARDPLGTRCYQIERYMKKEKPHKHLIFALNKVDLIPVWVTQKWVAILSSEHPTMAFHASITNPFGKGSLINLLRQFAKLHKDKKQISVGFIGYPNVGKSSIINTLRAKKVCNVAPIAGETKVWQYVTLMRRIYLVDCPGVVYPSADSKSDFVLKGIVRVEMVKTPEDYISDLLKRVKKDYIKQTYKVQEWTSAENFLEQLAKKCGKLLKGGEPDFSTMAKMVLNDWQRGKIPYFVRPPGSEEGESSISSTEQQTGNAVEQGQSADEAAKVQAKQEETTESKDIEATETIGEAKVKKVVIPKVRQDLSKINVAPTFIAEDIKKLELDTLEGDDSEVSESEEEEEEEVDAENREDDEKNKKDNSETTSDLVTKQEKCRENSIKHSNEMKKCMKDFVNDEQCEVLDIGVNDTDSCDKVKDIGENGSQSLGKNSTKKVRFDVECDDKTGSLTQTRKRKPEMVKQSRSGKFVVTEIDEEEDSPKKQKLNSKQRRRLDRESKTKKIGSQFYAQTNVKNKNRRK